MSRNSELRSMHERSGRARADIRDYAPMSDRQRFHRMQRELAMARDAEEDEEYIASLEAELKALFINGR